MSNQPRSTRPMTAAETKRHRQPALPSPRLFIGIIVLLLGSFLAWAWGFELDEVTTGIGKIVPSAHEQTIQSLEGGILKKLYVSAGDIVEKGQTLAQLDIIKSESAVQESRSQYRAALAMVSRLRAEVDGTALTFPDELADQPRLIQSQTQLYTSRRTRLQTTIAGLNTELELVRQELHMTAPYVAKGAASAVDVLRLRRQMSELQNKLADTRSQYLVQAREALAKASSDVQALRSVMRGRQDSLSRSTLKAPVRGIVKNVEVTTTGGVIPPNGKLMTIVPLDDRILVEARISPRDIAFIHPSQKALVKITAYDYSIYGALKGRVTIISPDTLQDEVKRDEFYYRVYIQTDSAHLENRAQQKFPILPGMIATVDIRTGQKTVLDYLLKPFNKAQEALRER
ncbi:HlyD family type I secretion periplasmic adaptor subunit [Pseudomonas sp. EL_65y_Pfl2_R95]|uniref:HlyD family type I secretion periplasmic adaptor subunit n=1 Tax=Pseudomonas sp. EL_65y_Pfl2_R95 TaxID=3088698 RepID=UPI0030DB912B